MRHLSTLVILSSAALLLVLTGQSLCQSENAQAGKLAEQSITGPWRADAVAILSENGAKRTLPINEQQPFNVVISDKILTMRVGDQKFAEMPYVLDAKQTPCTIDVKFQDQEMDGICELKGDNLKISLNNAKKERPKLFGAAGNNMDLLLHRFKGEPLMMINADGTGLRTLLAMPEYTSCGSPEWSHDGGKITFDTWRSVYGEDYTKSHVFVVNSDGTSPKDLGDGTLPSWSPDGKRIAYGRYISGNSVWIMNADGSDVQLIDENGWSPDWSPKKDELCYTIYRGQTPNLCVYNVKTKERRYLLEKEYRQVYWGLSWSPDGEWVCFKGDLPDGTSEIAVVNAQGQAKGFKVLLPNAQIPGVKDFDRYFSWSPDGKQILVPMMLESDANLQLYIFDPEGKTPPRKLVGQDPSVRNYGSSWSPDGKQIVLAYWPGNPVQNNVESPAQTSRAVPYTRIAIPAETSPTAPSGNTDGPLVLDIKPFYHVLANHPAGILDSLVGRPVIDGLPFEIGGQAFLYSQTVADRGEMDLPDTFKGIPVGRKFDELHLIHHTRWPDAEGQTVAYICLNYADGTKCILPIRYGVHVRDWYRLPSEEKELLTDPDTKICWRRPPVQYKAPVRVFKSKLTNPSPQKVVETIDVVSARSLASYTLLAATVANRDPSRPITPPPADNEPERKFDGKLVINVVDDVTGKPVEGALVAPDMTVEDEGVVASPFYTSAAGEGTIRYPIKLTTNISASVKKDGYLSKSDGWSSGSLWSGGNIPNAFTFRLTPLSPTPPQINRKDLIGTWILAGTPDNVVEPPKAGARLKFITDKDWTVTQADPDTGEVTFNLGGAYTLNGDEYVETVKYATENTKELISKVHTFKIKLQGDTLTIIGIGNPWTEVWKREK